MDQVKIGKFIAACRRKENLTQMQLAEKLNITDRAVSKWETGRALPDSSIMLELCDTLKITVNDLLSGEVINMNDYNKEMENKIIEMVKQYGEVNRALCEIYKNKQDAINEPLWIMQFFHNITKPYKIFDACSQGVLLDYK